MKSIAPGRYRHYKGHDYLVINLVRHSETEEYLVLYRPLYKMKADKDRKQDRARSQTDLWVRPLPMFLENVSIAGTEVPRFKYVGPIEEV